MRIQTNKKELSLNDLQTIILSHEHDARHKRKLKRYYLGNHDIFRKEGRKNNAPNNKLVSNYPAYITNMATGFFIGRPVVYKSISENDEQLQMLLDIFKYNDEAAHNLELAEEASITGEAYEVLYTDYDAQVRFATVPSEEVVLVCDSTLEGNITCAIRHYRVYDVDLVTYDDFVDVYDSMKVTHYGYNTTLKKISEEYHYFDDVPIIEYPNNKQHRGDFEDVITLIDAYNLAQSLTLDDMQDFTDAFLVLRGLGGVAPEDVRELRKNKVISLDGNDSGAEWLIKNLNDTYIENVKSRLQRDIHKFSSVPDMSDESFAGNASGVAIKYKLIGLEQIRSRKEREFKKALQRRIELISDVLTLKSKGKIDFRDINIQFTPNIPADNQESAQIVSQLSGLVSQKTLLGLLPFVEDPLEEIDELKKEREEEIAEHDAQIYPEMQYEHNEDNENDKSDF